MKYQEIITIEPGKRCGKPCVRGMRITVYDVLSYLAAGMTIQVRVRRVRGSGYGGHTLISD